MVLSVTRQVPVQEGLPPLRSWQHEALTAWRKNGSRGVVVAATGTGKTRVALEAIESARTEGSRILIVVPTIPLQEQWLGLLRYRMRMSPDELGTVGGRQSSFTISNRSVLAVLNSARTRLPDVVKHWRSEGEGVLLVADECHRLGSGDAAPLLKADYTSTLGLSATPQNEDGTFEQQISGALGPVVYELPLRRALDDGLLAPLHALNVYFELPPAELQEFRAGLTRASRLRAALRGDHSEEMGRAGQTLDVIEELSKGDERAGQLVALIKKNRRLVANSRGRRDVLASLISSGVLENTRAIIFNETIEQADSAHQMLRAAGIDAVLDHSKLSPPTRTQSLKRFSSGSSPVLVAVRTVDEGIDVPQANLAVIVSGSTSPRQRVQRIGRVVRPSGGVAGVISILAKETDEEYLVGMADSELLGSERTRTVQGTPTDEDIDWVKRAALQ